MTDAEFQALRERVVLLPVATAEDVHDLRLLVDEVARLRREDDWLLALDAHAESICEGCPLYQSERPYECEEVGTGDTLEAPCVAASMLLMIRRELREIYERAGGSACEIVTTPGR